MKPIRSSARLVPAVLLVLCGPVGGGSGQELNKPAMAIQCTPTTVVLSGGPVRVPNPIAHAIQQAGPGSMIRLSPGVYPSFSIGVNQSSPRNAITSGGRPGMPITIEGQGKVRIASGTGSDTIYISQQVKNGHFVFRNIDIEPGNRTAVIFARGGVHEGFRFYDCNIVGSYNHPGKRGKKSKWGVWGSQLKDFEFKGVRDYAEVKHIRDEHGFYIQNSQGDVTIEKVRAKDLGRTFCQFVSRSSEGPPGVGTILVKDCDVSDTGLAPGDAYKGGSTFTFGGRHTGTIRLEKNVYRCGFRKGMQHLTTKGSPYGTGALVMIDGGEREQNGRLILRDNDFRFAPGCGDRAVVSIGGCRDVQFLGKNVIVAGKYEVGLDLDPVEQETTGPTKSRLNARVRLSPRTDVKGEIRIRGKTATKQDLKRLAH